VVASIGFARFEFNLVPSSSVCFQAQGTFFVFSIFAPKQTKECPLALPPPLHIPKI